MPSRCGVPTVAGGATTTILPPPIPLPTPSFASPSRSSSTPAARNAPKLWPAVPRNRARTRPGGADDVRRLDERRPVERGGRRGVQLVVEVAAGTLGYRVAAVAALAVDAREQRAEVQVRRATFERAPFEQVGPADRIVECVPGKVLTGLSRRIAPGVEGIAIQDSAALDAALQQVKA